MYGVGRGVYLSAWCREGSIFECMVYAVYSVASIMIF